MSTASAPDSPSPEEAWATQWLAAVADGRSTMSQRKLASIEKRAGGLRLVKSVARELRVHLLQLTDEHGDVIVTASRNPFKVIA